MPETRRSRSKEKRSKIRALFCLPDRRFDHDRSRPSNTDSPPVSSRFPVAFHSPFMLSFIGLIHRRGGNS